LRSQNFTDRYVRHRNSLGYVEAPSTATDRSDATFTVVAGLANANCYSLRAVNAGGQYLRHDNYRLRLAADNGTAGFRGDATFCGRTGLIGSGTVSLESYNYPGFYIRHYSYELRVDRNDGTAAFRGDASFTVTSPLG
jgi:hypothetical protein